MAETLKPSLIRLENIFLNKIEYYCHPNFEPKGPQILMKTQIQVDVKTNENLRYITRCNIFINKDEQDSPFRITLEIDVVSSIEASEHVQQLKEFAASGAVFNAIMYAREVIRDITSRSKYNQLIMPLFDISQLSQQIK